MSDTQPPPVPVALREILKDYPAHIDRLQATLNTLINDPSPGVDPFERAVWLLDGQLENFSREAQSELAAAQAGGDTDIIERAKAKRILMLQASSKSRWIADRALSDYVLENRGALT